MAAGTMLLRPIASNEALPSTRVLVVAGIRLYREGLQAIMAREHRMSVVGTAVDVAEACAAVPRVRPDVVLLDAAPEPPANAVRALLAALPEVRIVVLGLAAPDVDAEVLACIEAGAAGYVTRAAGLPELVEAVACVARGELACSTSVAGALARSLARLSAASERPADGAGLTARERQIAELIAEGLSNKEIAGRLHIELPTVKNHVHRILGKLEVSRRGEAAARMRGVGIRTAVRD
jgi:two-component system nitrate/nitrite response regulator NarL